MRTNIICSIVNSNKHVLISQKIEMDNILNRDKSRNPCICKVDTSDPNQHNILCQQLQTVPDLAAAPTSIQNIPEAAVVAMIKTPVADPRAAAAAAPMIKSQVPVSMEITPITI